MEELRDLNQIYNTATSRFSNYDGKDFILPQEFKDQVTEINSSRITYNKYSAVVETRGTQNGVLNIFLPNQWFYIASYFTDFYNELQRYKKEALKVVTKERLNGLNGLDLTDEEKSRLDSLPLNEASKSFLLSFMTNYPWWNGAKTIDRADFYVSPILSSARLVNASQSYVADLCAYLADKQQLVDLILAGVEELEIAGGKRLFPLQQIFFGTPGSGKSHKVNGIVESIYPDKADREKYVVRTTFHPDSDYASFVGCYKPRMNGKDIEYKYTAQAFTDAYVKAWQEIKKESGKNVYLVIEEINRGNCAQIFGDLFQLLDRKNGVSEYPINADADLRQYLEGDEALGKDSEGIAEGKLKLPSNLYIWATMNTSDQSLFPMDSAFKRRWTWECVPIDYEKPESSEFTITIQGKQCNWHKFLREINAKIKDTTDSEDKQMGNFFINGNVDERQFVDKVMFYLWNDVFKEEYKTLKNHFRIPKEGDDNGEEFTFNDLFDKKDKNKDSKLLIGFMEYLKVPLV